MPMKSQAQRAYLHIHHPEIAAEFEAHTPKGKKLPQHIGDKKMKKQSHMSKLHESLGAKHGAESKHKQSMKSRVHEHEGMEHHEHVKHAMHHLKALAKHHKKK